MTTIAYRDGVMAGDSLVTGHDVRRGHARKVFTASNGALVGISGSVGLSKRFVAWIGNGEREDELPRVPDGCSLGAIVAYTDGRVAIFNERLIRQEETAPFEATGSGNEIALGALAMGASAEEAVRVALPVRRELGRAGRNRQLLDSYLNGTP